MRRILSICVFLLIFLLFSSLSVEACSCISSGPPCQSFWNTDVVFSGQVTEISEPTAKPRTKTANDENNYPVVSFPKKIVRFAVSESFRGTQEKLVEIETGRGGGDCGFAFESGQSYLVYAYRNKETGKLGTGICTRTQLLSKANEDLEYFRGLKDAKSGGMVYGMVTKYLVRKSGDEYKPNPPLADILLTFSGNGNIYEALTDEKGEYRLPNIAAGEYKMSVKVPEGMWGFEKEQTIKIPDKGCAVTYTALSTKTFLSGRVQTDQFEPADNIGINLIPLDQINKRYQKDTYSAWTDEQGNYKFKSIPAGMYYLGVRLDRLRDANFPYPRTFYPGTTDLKNAAQITIIEGQIIENFDFTLAKKLTTRTIRGIVQMPDGKPAKKTYLCLEEIEYSEGSMCQNGIETNDKGEFTFTAMNGLRYLIRSHINLQNNQRHAEPVEVPANGNVSDIKLVITEAGGSCEKCRLWKRNK